MNHLIFLNLKTVYRKNAAVERALQIYEQWIKATATAYRTYRGKTISRAREQMLWIFWDPVTRQTENINDKVRSWGEEARAADARQTVYSGISEALGVARVERWSEIRNQRKIKRGALNWQMPQGFGETSGAERGSFDLSQRTSIVPSPRDRSSIQPH